MMRKVKYPRFKYIGVGLCILFLSIGLAIYFIKKYKDKPSDNLNISTIIVPHHDLVADKRRETFEKLAPRTQNRRIILLAPNHYDSGVANIQTRSQTFTTQNGEIKVDNNLFKLVTENGVKETNATFEAEHGIKALLPDIAKYYPNSSIVPLVINKKANQDELTTVLDMLNKNCKDCLLIVSADFSHYQPFLLSKLHDNLTIRGLEKLDAQLLDYKAELEPMHHVWMAVKWAELHNTRRFVLDKHTNSHEVTNDYYAEGTTHIMGWYEKGQPVEPSVNISFAIAGSLIFNESEPKNNKNISEIFDQLGERVLWGTDLVMGKLMLREQASQRQAVPLKSLHFTHNFTDNVELVNKIDAKVLNKTDLVSSNGQQIKILSGKSSQISDEQIKQNKANNIIVYVEWESDIKQQRQHLAQSWIDNGADMVVGVNDEEISELELYKNRPIAYSLGNFVSLSKPDGYSIVLTGEFTGDKINLLPLLIKNQNYQPVLSRSADADKILSSKYLVQFKNFETDNRGGLLYSLPK